MQLKKNKNDSGNGAIKKKNRKKVVNPIIHSVFTRFAADDHDLSEVCN